MRIAIVLVLLIFVPVGCGGERRQPPAKSDIKVTDFVGETVRLKSPARRVVCLIESALSGIYMLRAQDRLVGVPAAVYRESAAPQYALLDERIRRKRIPAPGNWDFVNLESLVALQPDLVIVWSAQEEAVANIRRLGIPVYAVMLHRLEDVYKEITDLAILLDKNERARQLIKWTQNELNDFQSKGLGGRKKKIYFMWSQGLLHTAGKNSTVNQIIEAAGAVNACPLEAEHCVVNLESLLDWRPEILVMWHNDRLAPDDILTDSRLQSLPAVQTGQVRELPSVFYCDMWTLKFQYVIKMVARWSYPQRFSAVDLPSERRRMLRFLYGEQAGALLE
jgi:iron complex transport system substrate-binding protein